MTGDPVVFLTIETCNIRKLMRDSGSPPYWDPPIQGPTSIYLYLLSCQPLNVGIGTLYSKSSNKRLRIEILKFYPLQTSRHIKRHKMSPCHPVKECLRSPWNIPRKTNNSECEGSIVFWSCDHVLVMWLRSVQPYRGCHCQLPLLPPTVNSPYIAQCKLPIYSPLKVPFYRQLKRPVVYLFVPKACHNICYCGQCKRPSVGSLGLQRDLPL